MHLLARDAVTVDLVGRRYQLILQGLLEALNVSLAQGYLVDHVIQSPADTVLTNTAKEGIGHLVHRRLLFHQRPVDEGPPLPRGREGALGHQASQEGLHRCRFPVDLALEDGDDLAAGRLTQRPHNPHYLPLGRRDL